MPEDPRKVQKEPASWFAGKFTRSLNIKFAGAAFGLLLALLIAPGSRRLFLAQVGIALPVPGNLASVAGSQVGLRESDPFYTRIAVERAHAAAARFPNDLQVQIADAGTVLPANQTDPTLPEPLDVKGVPKKNVAPSVQKVQRLRALERRFRDSASLYANILRYEALGNIRVHHEVEQSLFSGEPKFPDRLIRANAMRIDQAAYLVYDRDAAAGERLDPDNAYFPFMRAIGLFGAQRDTEALAAIARAATKTEWREYYSDEVKGQWRLQDETSVNNSALFHSLSAAILLFPQYAQMRGAARVTIYKAMQAEQAGHFEAGLALREDVTRLGSLMCARSASLIGSIVGAALTEVAISRPAGATAIKSVDVDENDGPVQQSKKLKTAKERRQQSRLQFDAYLHQVDAAGKLDTFHTAQQASDELKETIYHYMKTSLSDQPIQTLQTLIIWWIVDLVTLSNILWLLILGGMAGLFLRIPGLSKGLALPIYMRLALPSGLISGGLLAPILLTDVSPYLQHISSGHRDLLLLVGLAPFMLLMALPAKTGDDRLLRRLSVFACSLPIGALVIGFYLWQARGLAGIAELRTIYYNMSSAGSWQGPDVGVALLWFTPVMSLLIGSVTAIISRACRVPLAVGLARSFRGLAVPIAAILFLVYGGMLLLTMRSEAMVQYRLERMADNEGQYVAELLGKQWAGPATTPKVLQRKAETMTDTN